MTPIQTSINKFVWLYPISIKTAEPIGPIFCLQQEKNLPCKNTECFYLEIYQMLLQFLYKHLPVQCTCLGDSDEETDYSKMDMGNKKGPVGRSVFK